MNKAVTISLSDKLIKQIRNRQSKLITRDNDGWNFSETVAYLVGKGLEK